MLDIRRLFVLRAVAELGSMTAAAEPLGYTPAAVSAHIAALERQTGTTLLERHRRGVRLTAAGALLAEHAEAIRQRVDHAECALRDLLDVRSGRLRVVGFPSAATALLPEVIGAFHRGHPDVEMTMNIHDNDSCPELVREGTHDLAVVFDGYPDQHVDLTDLCAHRLLADPLAVALTADHRFAARSALTVEDLRGEAWIRDNSPDPSCRELLDHLAGRAGFRPHVAFDAGDYVATGRLVAAGVGVALVPSLGADQMPAGVRLVPITPAVTRQVHVVVPHHPSPSAAALRDLLIEASPSRPDA